MILGAAGPCVYYARRGELVVLLLCGGTKSSQQVDIARAVKLAKQL